MATVMQERLGGIVLGAVFGLTVGLPVGHHIGTIEVLDYSVQARETCERAVGTLRNVRRSIDASGAKADTLIALAGWHRQNRPTIKNAPESRRTE